MALLFGHRLFSSVNKAVIVGAVFFVTFSIKFLCGYDYMTMVVLCFIAPVIYYGVKFDEPLRAIAARLVGVRLVACLAFAFPISLQVSRIADDFFAGLSTWLDAQKRILTTANWRLSQGELRTPHQCRREQGLHRHDRGAS